MIAMWWCKRKSEMKEDEDMERGRERERKNEGK